MELLLAITLLVVVLGMALPRIDAVRSSCLRDEDARSVAVLLRSASDTAIALRATTVVEISPVDARTVETRVVDRSDWPQETTTIPVAAPRAREATATRRVVLANPVDMVADQDRILFYSDGSSSGGELAIRDGRDRVHHRIRVEVDLAHVLVEAAGAGR